MNLKYRPFAVWGFTLLLSLFTILYFSYDLSVLFICVGAFLLLITFIFKSLREKFVPLYVAGAMIIAGVSSYLTCNDAKKLSELYVDKSVYINGVITDEPDFSNSRYYYIINLDEIDGQNVDCKLRLSVPYEIDAEPYDSVLLDAKIYKIASQSREVQNYYFSKGIFLGAYALDDEDFKVEVTSTENYGFNYQIFKLRERLVSNITHKLPNEHGATVIAMLFGDKSGLSEARIDSFREAGVAPIFAVSGLHLSIWVMGLHSILDKFKLKKRVNSAIGIAFTVVFMLLASLSPSVCRAGLMMILLLSSNLFYRKSDSLNSLGFAAFALCLVNPFIAIDTGFLLSFSATLAIVTIVPLADKYLFSVIPKNFIGDSVKSTLTAITVGVSASVGVLPATILFIGRISIYSVLSNLILSPIAAVCMLTGGISAITYSVNFISDFFALISGVCAKFMLAVIDFICNTSVTTFSVDNIFWKCGALCSVCVLVFVMVVFKGRNRFKAFGVGLATTLLVFGLSAYYYYNGLTQIRVLNVGNGISAVINDNTVKLALTGEADDYLKTLKINERLNQISTDNPDLLILADKDAAYDSANLDIIKSLDYNKIILPEANSDIKSVALQEKLIESTYISTDIFDTGNIRLNIQNEFSVAYCTFENTTVLIVFDTYKKAEIPKEYLNADYLVCCGYIPDCIKPQLFENVIICGEKEKLVPIYNYVLNCGGRPVMADDYDEVIINVRNGKHNLFFWEE